MKRLLVLGIGYAMTLNAQFPDFTPPTALIGALMHNDTQEAERLLAAGANPNEAKMAGFPAVFFPLAFGNREVFHAMVEKGADLQARDVSGSTALMWASANESGDPALVEELLRMGLDPRAQNRYGETALTWALRRGRTPAVAALEKAGMSNQEAVRKSAQKGLALLQKSSPQFVEVSSCVSCHHQFLPQMAAAAARAHGVPVDEQAVRAITDSSIKILQPLIDEPNSKDAVPDPSVSISYALLGLAADNYPADSRTAAMARVVAAWQMEDGGFRALPMRPPIEGSHFTATALSLRALQLYGTNSGEQVRRATDWLMRANPGSNEDRVMQLLGLGWANADRAEIRERAEQLLDEQRPDGGWGQLPGLESDAYATGQALVALRCAAKLPGSDPRIQRGVAFLVRTQIADGSWLVRTRSFPFQPLKNSGFPHGRDQWISAAGTSWAVMALSLSLPTQQLEPGVLLSSTGRPN